MFMNTDPALTACQLTLDHSTSIEEEIQRIKSEHPDDSCAVMNDRVKGSLKVTRAFGAGFLKQVENVCLGNSGIKDGVSVPKGNTIKVLMDRMVPVELLSTLQGSVTMDPGMKLPELELTVLKTCLRAFYRRKGGYVLPEYQNPKYIQC